MSKKTIAIIPARGRSKGIKNKNLVNFCGKPLIYWTINQALNSKLIDNVYVSSDSREILNYSRDLGSEIIFRPKSISGDRATSESALIHAVNNIKAEADAVVFLQATSPIRNKYDIDNAIKKFKKDRVESLFSVSNLDDFNLWLEKDNKFKSINYDWKQRNRRQDKKDLIWCENGSIYVTKTKALIKNNNRIAKKFSIYEMKVWQSFEIDEKKDIPFQEVIFKNLIK